MTTRLTLICHGSTSATASASFPDDEPLEESCGRPEPIEGRLTSAWTSPALRAQQSASLLGLEAEIDPALRDCDYGRWSGRTLASLQAEDPQGIAAWLCDPEAAPHGGESLVDLVGRVGAWLAERGGERGRFVAVTHAAVMRAALLDVLGAPAQAFWRIDIEPFARVELGSDGRRWTLRMGPRRRGG